MADIRAPVGGDKPRPYRRSISYGVAAGFIPAHTIATLITYKSNMTYRTYRTY